MANIYKNGFNRLGIPLSNSLALSKSFSGVTIYSKQLILMNIIKIISGLMIMGTVHMTKHTRAYVKDSTGCFQKHFLESSHIFASDLWLVGNF